MRALFHEQGLDVPGFDPILLKCALVEDHATLHLTETP